MKHLEGRGHINTLDELREEVYAIRNELPQEIGKILHQLLDANLESRTAFELCTKMYELIAKRLCSMYNSIYLELGRDDGNMIINDDLETYLHTQSGNPSFGKKIETIRYFATVFKEQKLILDDIHPQKWVQNSLNPADTNTQSFHIVNFIESAKLIVEARRTWDIRSDLLSDYVKNQLNGRRLGKKSLLDFLSAYCPLRNANAHQESYKWWDGSNALHKAVIGFLEPATLAFLLNDDVRVMLCNFEMVQTVRYIGDSLDRKECAIRRSDMAMLNVHPNSTLQSSQSLDLDVIYLARGNWRERILEAICPYVEFPKPKTSHEDRLDKYKICFFLIYIHDGIITNDERSLLKDIGSKIGITGQEASRTEEQIFKAVETLFSPDSQNRSFDEEHVISILPFIALLLKKHIVDDNHIKEIINEKFDLEAKEDDSFKLSLERICHELHNLDKKQCKLIQEELENNYSKSLDELAKTMGLSNQIVQNRIHSIVSDTTSTYQINIDGTDNNPIYRIVQHKTLESLNNILVDLRKNIANVTIPHWTQQVLKVTAELADIEDKAGNWVNKIDGLLAVLNTGEDEDLSQPLLTIVTDHGTLEARRLSSICSQAIQLLKTAQKDIPSSICYAQNRYFMNKEGRHSSEGDSFQAPFEVEGLFFDLSVGALGGIYYLQKMLHKAGIVVTNFSIEGMDTQMIEPRIVTYELATNTEELPNFRKASKLHLQFRSGDKIFRFKARNTVEMFARTFYLLSENNLWNESKLGEDWPVKTGRVRYMINTLPYHKSNNAFSRPIVCHWEGRDYYFEINITISSSSLVLLEMCKKMDVDLEFLEWNPRIVFLGETIKQEDSALDTFIQIIEKLVEKDQLREHFAVAENQGFLRNENRYWFRYGEPIHPDQTPFGDDAKQIGNLIMDVSKQANYHLEENLDTVIRELFELINVPFEFQYHPERNDESSEEKSVVVKTNSMMNNFMNENTHVIKMESSSTSHLIDESDGQYMNQEIKTEDHGSGTHIDNMDRV